MIIASVIRTAWIPIQVPSIAASVVIPTGERATPVRRSQYLGGDSISGPRLRGGVRSDPGVDLRAEAIRRFGEGAHASWTTEGELAVRHLERASVLSCLGDVDDHVAHRIEDLGPGASGALLQAAVLARCGLSCWRMRSLGW